MEKEELTYGEKLVNVTHNPSELICVAVVKSDFAKIIDDIDKTREDATDPEVKRLCSIAITQAQIAKMCAVEALTYNR